MKIEKFSVIWWLIILTGLSMLLFTSLAWRSENSCNQVDCVLLSAFLISGFVFIVLLLFFALLNKYKTEKEEMGYKYKMQEKIVNQYLEKVDWKSENQKENMSNLKELMKIDV